ncbi:hypothetical protein MC885_021767 [Smutsia gigantea]|nr:hypothetical protein MC885_021767 [Smutsia gigantea]
MPIPASPPRLPPSSLLLPLLLGLTAKPSLPEVSGPSNRASPDEVVNFTCTSIGFFPKIIDLKWFKNGVELPALQTFVLPPGNASSYTISSTTSVTLALSSLSAQITCQVAHSELPSPLSGHVNISKFLQGARAFSFLFGPLILLGWKLFPLTLLSIISVLMRSIPSNSSLRMHEDADTPLWAGAAFREGKEGTHTGRTADLVSEERPEKSKGFVPPPCFPSRRTDPEGAPTMMPEATVNASPASSAF